MKTLPALASLLAILACVLWIAALAGPWYHSTNLDGTEQHMGHFGSYATGHPTELMESAHTTSLRAHQHEDDQYDRDQYKHKHKHGHKHGHKHEHAHDREFESEDDEAHASPTQAPTGAPTPSPSPGMIPGSMPPPPPPPNPNQSTDNPADYSYPRHSQDQQQQGQGQGQQPQDTHYQTGAGTVTPKTSPGATSGNNPSTSTSTPPGYGHGHGHGPAKNNGYGHKKQQQGEETQQQYQYEHEHGRRLLEKPETRTDINQHHTFPYHEAWVKANKALLILAIIVSGISALLQLWMAWTVGRNLHKGTWVTSPTTAILACVLSALAGVHGLAALFVFLSQRHQLPHHGHFDYGYTLNIIASGLALMSPILFYYTIETDRYESLLGDETVTGRRKYASVE